MALALSPALGGRRPWVLPSLTSHLPHALTFSSAAGLSLSLPDMTSPRPSVHPGNRCSAPRSSKLASRLASDLTDSVGATCAVLVV
eukprot:4220903-Pyramimonas_sp.AAC.1